MKFVGLLSGGKDSCYNIQESILNNHELLCVCNLYPSLPDVNEIHSFMYQTAAHTAIPMLSECFNVPLYRKCINYQCNNIDLRYNVCINDEVEDLYDLLKDVLTRHPDIEGVACGTILSNYQRFRLENVCTRLNLTPLTYLWQLSRDKIYTRIIESGTVAILVKVAGAGLVPAKHLNKTLMLLHHSPR